MSKFAYAALAGALAMGFATAPAHAASPFDGTWKTELSTVQPSKRPDAFAIKDGMFDCSSCIPVVKIKADGVFHAVKGHPAYDELAVKVVDANTFEQTRKRGGRVVAKAISTLSADGKTLHDTYTGTLNAGAQPVTSEGNSTRVGPAPAGAHAASGSWQATMAGAKASDSGLLITFRMDGDVLHMSTPNGISYAAKVGGAPAPVKGDPGAGTAAVKKVGDRELVETDMLNGKVMTIYHMTVSADGKTMTTVVEDRKYGTTSTARAAKV